MLDAVRPRALRAGSRLAIVSPASAPKPERVLAGARALEQMGYETTIAPHALCSGPLYYAGTAEERAADLQDAFCDDAVDGIVCTRGGWGSAELLPLLDARLIRAHAKVFIGYSDHTSLHMWLRREAGLITFYGPMVSADFSREAAIDAGGWESSLCASAPWQLGAADGLRVLRPGVAEGPLVGGCLSIIAESMGTPFAPMAEPCILFLEDVGTKPYQWDRMLLHLRYAGVLERATGLVFGDMTQSAPAQEDGLIERAILHATREFRGPIAIGLRSGHVDHHNVTLPLGVAALLDLRDEEEPRLHLLEGAVRV